MGDDEPRYGYGAHGRALWTALDREAELIRSLLRWAGHRECSAQVGGFVVDAVSVGTDGLALFSLTCTDEALRRVGELGRYSALLRGDGFQIVMDPQDDHVLEIWKLPPVGDPRG